MIKYLFSIVIIQFLVSQSGWMERVSIINLIATPERYDQKTINVKGFFLNEFENRALFLDKASAVRNISENGVTLIFDGAVNSNVLEKYQNQYVEIEGVFNMAKENNKNSFSHYISKINKIILIDK